MPLWSSTRPGIRARALVKIPATLTGDGGIDVSKEAGIWTITPDWSALSLITSASVAQTQQVWVQDPTTEVKSRVALSSVVQALGYTGAGISLNFTADLTATSDADPGSGKLRFNNASQNAATVIYIDDLDVNGMDLTTLVATLDDSSSPVKGHISITKVGDATKRLIFSMTALTDASGYTKLTVSNLASSATNPFAEGDTLLFGFTRNGDATGGTVELSDVDILGGTAITSAAVDDLLALSDTSDSGASKTITVADFWEVINAFTAETAPDVADLLALYDASASTTDKITLANLFKVINGLTADATPDNAADYLVTYDASATAAKKVLLEDIGIGKQTVGAAAGSLFPATTNGCAALSQAETSTNKINYKYLAFDATSIEYAWCAIPTPKSYNASTLTARFNWTHPATTTNFGVVWQIEIFAAADDDALDTAVGTAVTVTDTGGTTQDFYQSAATGAITPSNTAAKQDWLFIRVSRKATDAADTLAVDAHLIGVEFMYSTDKNTDD